MPPRRSTSVKKKAADPIGTSVFYSTPPSSNPKPALSATTCSSKIPILKPRDPLPPYSASRRDACHPADSVSQTDNALGLQLGSSQTHLAQRQSNHPQTVYTNQLIQKSMVEPEASSQVWDDRSMSEFPFPIQPQGSTTSTAVSSTPSRSSYPTGHTQTPSSHVTNLFSTWQAFTPSPSTGRQSSHPDTSSILQSPEESELALTDLIHEEYIESSPSTRPDEPSSAKKNGPIPRTGFQALRLPSESGNVHWGAVDGRLAQKSPFTPGSREQSRSLHARLARRDSSPRPATPVPQRQLSWSAVNSRCLTGSDGDRRGSAGSPTSPAPTRSLPPARAPSLTESSHSDSLPSAGLSQPDLSDVFSPHYELSSLQNLSVTPPLAYSDFRDPFGPGHYTLASFPEIIDPREKLGIYGERFGSEIAATCLRHHPLLDKFKAKYTLGDELGCGGFGFVCSALKHAPKCAVHGRRVKPDVEVAVKFIFKSKMGGSAAESITGLPLEAYVLKRCRHPGIIGFVELMEDDRFFYLIQELHGDPWAPGHTLEPPKASAVQASSVPSAPYSPSPLDDPIGYCPTPAYYAFGNTVAVTPSTERTAEVARGSSAANEGYPQRPGMGRRASHDLFEAVEHQRFDEVQARYIFKQIVDAVAYLHQRNIYHRDLKDENIVIDRNLQVKIIDFGSAVIEERVCPPTLYDTFRGTVTYAASEVLSGKPYHAGPADIWSLGILLSIIMTGEAPFPDSSHAREGRIKMKYQIPSGAADLLRRCLNPSPEFRITIQGVRSHYWLQGREAKPLTIL